MTQKRNRKPRPNKELPVGAIEEAAIEYVASGLGLEEEKPGAVGIAEHFDEIVAAEVKALDRRGLGFTPAFDMGQSVRDRIGAKLSCFTAAPEARPGPVWVVCPKCEFAFDPNSPERDYRYEVEVMADNGAQLTAAINALLAAANQSVLFAGLRIWLHAAGRHAEPAVKMAGGQVKKIVELIFRASEP